MFFADELFVVTHDRCDQDRTCFLRHTDKCFCICSDGCYSRRGWPVPIQYATGIQDTSRTV